MHLLTFPLVLGLALRGAAQYESDFAAHAHGANQRSVAHPTRCDSTIQLSPHAIKLIRCRSSLLWGAYRPNLYFGLRPRIPNSLMTGERTCLANKRQITEQASEGLMWFGTHDFSSYTSALERHCSRRPRARRGECAELTMGDGPRRNQTCV